MQLLISCVTFEPVTLSLSLSEALSLPHLKQEWQRGLRRDSTCSAPSPGAPVLRAFPLSVDLMRRSMCWTLALSLELG